MRFRRQTLLAALVAALFLVLLPFFWEDKEISVSKISQLPKGVTVLQTETPAPATVKPPEEDQEVNVDIPSLQLQPFSQYVQYMTPFQELANNDVNAVKVSVQPFYDPFAQDVFPQPPQNIDNSGMSSGGGGAGGGNFSGLADLVGTYIPTGNFTSGVTGNGSNGGIGNGNGGGVGTTPPVQVPEPETYVLLGTLLTAAMLIRPGCRKKVTLIRTR